MEDKELFIEYYRLKRKYKNAKHDYEKELEEKEKCLKESLIGASDPNKELTISGISNKPLSYTIRISQIEENIITKRNIKDNLEDRLKLKEEDLRNSKDILDRIYVYCFLENRKPSKIYRLIPCSRSSAYNYKEQIDNKLAEVKKKC